jgi:hypothetical protein
MFNSFGNDEYMPCERCGAALAPTEQELHVCDPERRAQFEAFQVRHELAELDRQVAAFLESPRGRFAVYYAERDRLRRAA